MSEVRVHVNVTHPDGEGDITDVVLPEETMTSEVAALVTAEHGHLFVPGDVIDLTIEGHFAPFDSFTVPHVIEDDGHMSWCERNCDTAKTGEHACIVFEREHTD